MNSPLMLLFNMDDKTSKDELRLFADFIKEKRIETPILLLLEAHKPIFRIAHASMLIFEPLIFFIAKSKKWKVLKKVLEDKEYCEELIVLIEKR